MELQVATGEAWLDNAIKLMSTDLQINHDETRRISRLFSLLAIQGEDPRQIIHGSMYRVQDLLGFAGQLAEIAAACGSFERIDQILARPISEIAQIPDFFESILTAGESALRNHDYGRAKSYINTMKAYRTDSTELATVTLWAHAINSPSFNFGEEAQTNRSLTLDRDRINFPSWSMMLEHAQRIKEEPERLRAYGILLEAAHITNNKLYAGLISHEIYTYISHLPQDARIIGLGTELRGIVEIARYTEDVTLLNIIIDRFKETINTEKLYGWRQRLQIELMGILYAAGRKSDFRLLQEELAGELSMNLLTKSTTVEYHDGNHHNDENKTKLENIWDLRTTSTTYNAADYLCMLILAQDSENITDFIRANARVIADTMMTENNMGYAINDCLSFLAHRHFAEYAEEMVRLLSEHIDYFEKDEFINKWLGLVKVRYEEAQIIDGHFTGVDNPQFSSINTHSLYIIAEAIRGNLEPYKKAFPQNPLDNTFTSSEKEVLAELLNTPAVRFLYTGVAPFGLETSYRNAYLS